MSTRPASVLPDLGDVAARRARLVAALGHLVARAQPIAVTVVDTPPGMGSAATVRKVAEALDMRLVDMRMASMGTMFGTTERSALSGAAEGSRTPVMILLDECGSASRNLLQSALRVISGYADTAGLCAIVMIAHGDGEEITRLARDTFGTIAQRNVEMVSVF